MPPRKKTTKLAAKEMLYRVTMRSKDKGLGDTPEIGNYGGTVTCVIGATSKKDAVKQTFLELARTKEYSTFFRTMTAFPDIIHVELALHPSTIDTFVDQYEKDHPEVFEETTP